MKVALYSRVFKKEISKDIQLLFDYLFECGIDYITENLKKAKIGDIVKVEINSLQEYVNVSQKEPGLKRKWFSDDKYVLIIWFDKLSKIKGFQILYGGSEKNCIISWDDDGKFSHILINNYNLGSPKSLGYISQDIVSDFTEHASTIDKNILKFILGKIEDGNLTRA